VLRRFKEYFILAFKQDQATRIRERLKQVCGRGLYSRPRAIKPRHICIYKISYYHTIKAIFHYYQVLVVFVAGKQSAGPSIPLNQATRGLRLKGVDIFAIAVPSVADIDENDLYEIATKSENVMTAKTYRESVNLAEDVSKMACGRFTCNSTFYG
jgi:hypothetical protein